MDTLCTLKVRILTIDRMRAGDDIGPEALSTPIRQCNGVALYDHGTSHGAVT